MTLTTHALVGAAAASLFPAYPYAAFAAGFVSHLAIDALPHWDYGQHLHSIEKDPARRMHTDMKFGKHFLRDLSVIGADALLGFVLTFVVAWLLQIPPEVALVGAGAGVLPDLLQFVYYKIRTTPFEPALHYLQKLHVWLQKGIEHPEWGWQKGLGLQALLVVFLLLLVSFLV